MQKLCKKLVEALKNLSQHNSTSDAAKSPECSIVEMTVFQGFFNSSKAPTYLCSSRLHPNEKPCEGNQAVFN